MLTTEDIQKLIEAEREVFTTKEDFARIEQMFSNLQSSVDAYAKKADTYFQEMSAMRHALKRHEEALQKIAQKVGIKLDF
ncbi:MAG: hypothetical protein A3C85_03390 [Candidatus Doudnabacteria bacterium RIFCSPHIGHO2_02_FULL_48_21]|uniref:Uncharacterized protein n=1 Tax=Candidatus Doudnabacteria bacterium RIFCSPLOWO2_02_FULL_48_13 TaxID=1817845 RepID=A0A1F5QAX8_9BACT|nr:MAG: hypothetical protein A3K05_03730 [Candidatus Doudnabacteria bacterium RIFCSPHIGHO2_01_48_18]OGE78412.1 MAG: hypothetical protein A2668_02150 [Candidatus Doudnabacteria bacterium RIFCSPHIGHO2_01_FULL_48_180]OGE91436.1 MAG: hypothetical protein A3F44_00790 [Candidatus Doudnabacteria bacterium RIFCSPHIGHO2_12_FULL_47_25]OGE93284.1 MAG: hypothetical protein A3C85_03390 [Candidatus Doudnabacteria bacterium RIFCSPHIGHO2_02_FULL_48_21]OGE96828.1 MAG: hypothetical protein A3A83_02190 [Candidatu